MKAQKEDMSAWAFADQLDLAECQQRRPLRSQALKPTLVQAAREAAAPQAAAPAAVAPAAATPAAAAGSAASSRWQAAGKSKGSTNRHGARRRTLRGEAPTDDEDDGTDNRNNPSARETLLPRTRSWDLQNMPTQTQHTVQTDDDEDLLAQILSPGHVDNKLERSSRRSVGE